MYVKQHTLKEAVRFSGAGLHSGDSVTLTVKPAPEHYGFRFKRVDLAGQPEIPATVDFVLETQRSTTIGVNGARIQTVEHLLAALAGLQIDNALLEIDSSETPALDGSAAPYVEALRLAGTVEQKANREFYVIDEPVHFQESDRNIDLAALPFDDFRVTVMIDYNSTKLGVQHATMVRLEDFATEIAPCRTFCFWHELQALISRGLIKGGNMDNAIVIVEQEASPAELQAVAALFNLPPLEVEAESGILNNVTLHFPNEPARHKLLDLIGDLTLIGAPLKGQIVAIKPGHAANVAFARKIQDRLKKRNIIKKYQQSEARGVVFDIKAIFNILPHRYPFLLVDRITDFSENSIEGYKNVTINEPFFVGHFEGNPIMPGVLILEAMAQVGGVLLLNIVDNPQDYWVYFVAIDNARFRKPVLPGDQLVFKLDLVNMRRGICKMVGKAFVDDTLVCEADLVASLVKKNP